MVKAVAKPNEEIHFGFSPWRHLATGAAAKGSPGVTVILSEGGIYGRKEYKPSKKTNA